MAEGSFSAKKKERVAMKRQYQIEQQRAVQQFRRLATEQNPNIQMVLPLAEIVGLLQQGVGNLLRQAGRELMHLVMDEEVKSLAGERHEQHAGRQAHRWGKEDGYCVVAFLLLAFLAYRGLPCCFFGWEKILRRRFILRSSSPG